MEINLVGGWIAILTGLVTGVGLGMFFHDEQWLGGYGSWPRRMLRLGHISLIGTGLLNILFALSIPALQVASPGPDELLRIGSLAMLAGAVTMPTVCTAAAFWKPARHLFFVPVLCLLAGTAEVVYRGIMR
jgi:hypothetical protein